MIKRKTMSEKKMKYNQFFNEEVRHTSKENPHLLWMLLKLGEKKSKVSWWTEMMNLEDSKAHIQKLHYRSDVEHSPKGFSPRLMKMKSMMKKYTLLYTDSTVQKQPEQMVFVFNFYKV